MAVSKRRFELSPGEQLPLPAPFTSMLHSVLPPVYLLTSSLPQYYCKTPAQPAISNHGLASTVYRSLDCLARVRTVVSRWDIHDVESTQEDKVARRGHLTTLRNTKHGTTLKQKFHCVAHTETALILRGAVYKRWQIMTGYVPHSTCPNYPSIQH